MTSPLKEEYKRLMALGYLADPAGGAVQDAIKVATNAAILSGQPYDICFEKYKELLSRSTHHPTTQEVYEAVRAMR